MSKLKKKSEHNICMGNGDNSNNLLKENIKKDEDKEDIFKKLECEKDSKNIKKEKKKKKKRIKRCNFCDKDSSCRVKLKLTDYPCRCGLIFCSKHRHKHNCSFDYKGDYEFIYFQ